METLIAISSSLLPLGIVALTVAAIKRINQRSFAELIKNGSVAQLPSTALRVPELRYGFSRYANIAKMAEEADKLLFKIPLLPVLTVPYSQIEKVESTKHRSGLHVFILHLKTESRKTLAFALREDQLKAFPKLLAKSTPLGQGSASKTQNPKSLTVPIQLKKPLTNPINKDHVRNAIVVGILVAGAVYLLSQWL